ncbi:carboxylating nicotinate-nucleotide diphosphorylase [Rhizobium sp. CRIBSB]|nr:carboxylating nicotinate-nucleotide diphosphorylase [Rhizobium sp. CRIBSB]
MTPVHPFLPDLLIEPVVRLALAEDLGRTGDVTARACIPPGTRLKAVFVGRRAGVMAGGDCVRLAVLAMDPAASITLAFPEGAAFEAGTELVAVEGDARAILAAERTALNLLGRMCGIATLTRTYVAAVAGTSARVVDTRKTTPGLRALEKHAVLCGGGFNHRFGLDDAILIKDNHIAVCGGAAEAVRRARASVGHLMKIEVEVDTLDQFDDVLAESPDVVMLDNFTLPMLRQAVERADVSPFGRPVLEASGGVSLDTIGEIARTGVDVISVGALTHSAAALDVGLDAR